MRLLLWVASCALAGALSDLGISIPPIGDNLPPPPAAPRGPDPQSRPVDRAPAKSPGRLRAEREYRRNLARLSDDLLPLSAASLPAGKVGQKSFYAHSSRTLEMKAIDMDGMSDADLEFKVPIEHSPAERIPSRELANAAYILQGVSPGMSPEDLSFLAENAALALAGEALRVALPPPGKPGRALQDRATDAAARAAESGRRFRASRAAMQAAFDASTDGVAKLRERREALKREEPPDPLVAPAPAPAEAPSPPEAAEAREPVIERVPLEAIEAAIAAREQARRDHIQAQRDLREVSDEIVCDDCKD
ncbi:MAG: hypothetical protein HY553_22430 [Elusimicrobia bacterium]|nr:hypothetical protein [Elusimicrobiota bacterium]